MKYISFDPVKHEREQLYQYVTIEDGDFTMTAIEEADVSFEEAARTPWYYMVESYD